MGPLRSILSFIPFFSPYLVLVVTLLGVLQGGLWAFSGFLFVFVFHPILDHFGGQASDSGVYPGSSFTHGFASALLWLYLPAQTLVLAMALNQVGSGGMPFENLGFWASALSVGTLSGGMGITIAHELIHRRRRWERGIGILLLFQVNYTHFRVEHVLGHHRWVGTPRDPATAREGESLFRFLPRTLLGSLKSAFHLDRKFVVKALVLQLALSLAVAFLAGPAALLFHLIQSAVAILMLETVNYIEHYGLSRKELRPGVYEAVTEVHSWNSLHRFTNWFLFNLGMHAEHHAHPLVPYQKLSPIPRPRTLPLGYSALLWAAWIPPVWRRIFVGRLNEGSAN